MADVHRDLVISSFLDRRDKLDIVLVYDQAPFLEKPGHIGSGNRAEQVTTLRSAGFDFDRHTVKSLLPGIDIAHFFFFLELDESLLVLKTAQAAAIRRNGFTFRQQVVARVACFHLDHVAYDPELGYVFSEDYFHCWSPCPYC